MDYCRHCRAMVEQAEAAEGTVQSAKIEPQGIIKAIARRGLRANAMIANFIALYPKVFAHQQITNLEVGVDIALRVRFLPRG